MQERWFSSLFRKSTWKDLEVFSWESITNELKQEAPFFFQFLVSVVAPTRRRIAVKGVYLKSRYPAICTGGVILLKERNSMMSAVQQLVGVILFHGDIHKTVNNHNSCLTDLLHLLCSLGSCTAKQVGINC